MGAGIIECDVTFTERPQSWYADTRNAIWPVFRPIFCKLSWPTPADSHSLQPNKAHRPAPNAVPVTSPWRSLNPCARPDVKNSQATSVDEFLAPLDSPVIDQPNQCGTVMSHRDSIELIRDLGTAFTPELKRPEVPMPFNGFSQQDYAKKLLTEYQQAGIPTKQVYPQSFNINDVRYWIENHPQYAQQTIWLVPRQRQLVPLSFAELQSLQAEGLHIIAPPIPMLVQQNSKGQVEPTAFAKAAKASGLKIITWTFESARSHQSRLWRQSWVNA